MSVDVIERQALGEHEHLEMVEQLGNLLGQLSDRERKVLELRFGLRGEEPRTLESLGVEMGVSKERVRQIQVEALKRLRDIMEKQGLNSEALFSV